MHTHKSSLCWTTSRVHAAFCGKGTSWNCATQWFQLLHQTETVLCLTQTPSAMLGTEGFPSKQPPWPRRIYFPSHPLSHKNPQSTTYFFFNFYINYFFLLQLPLIQNLRELALYIPGNKHSSFPKKKKKKEKVFWDFDELGIVISMGNVLCRWRRQKKK